MSCPDDKVLMAMVEHTLEPPLLHEIEVHIDSCPHCRQLIAAAVAGAGPTALGTPAPPGDGDPLGALVDVTISQRYVIKSLLGRGGMGAVYLAHDRTLGRDVALKLHRAGSGNDRLHREAMAMAKLAHPNVVTVFEVAAFENRMYVAMEYVKGGTLRSWLNAAPRSRREIVDMLLGAGAGLAAAHAAGLVHRDFKPENVLVGDDRRPRVSDFGLARVGRRASAPILPGPAASSLDTPLTETGTVMGTPAYMSPEQLAGAEEIDARSDQFAFCVVAWECLFGVRPFAGTTMAAIALAIERHELQRPAARSAVPPRVRDAIERGLAMEPADRHADMPALLARLRAAAAPSRRRRLVLGAALVAVPIAVIGIELAVSGSDEAKCDIGIEALGGAWDQPVRDGVRTAFVAADGAQMYQRVAGVIDEYEQAWLAMRRANCKARARGEQSETLLDLRVACLDRKRDELRALTFGFAQADRQVVLGSVRAALGLTAIAECGDRVALISPVRPPDAQIRARVEVERGELAAVRALRLLGKTKDALPKALVVVDHARELKYRPLEAEALLVAGDLQDRAGETETAIKLLEQAVVAADAGNHKRAAAEAWSTLAWLLGYADRKFERAQWAVQMAAAAIEGLGGNPELSAQLLNYEALILETKGQPDAAKPKYLAALAAREKIGGGDDWKLALVLNDLGGVERKLGDYTAAHAHHERALAIRRKVFGERHPYVFSSLNNLGNVAWSRGDYAQAESYFKSALAIAPDIFPAQHPQVALALANLGSTYEHQDKLDDAVETYRRALAMYEATRGPDHPDVADQLHNLGNALAGLGRTDEAKQSYERAVAILDKGEPDPELARLLDDYGDQLMHGKDRRAEAVLQRALAMTKQTGGDAIELAFPETLLGELYANSGRANDAKPLLEAALAARKADKTTHPDELARTELALAKLTNDRELAQSAQQHLEAAGATRHELYKAVVRWLR